MGQQAEIAALAGDLLIRSGVVTLELLQDAVALCEKTGESLGRVLEMNGYVNAAAVEAAVELKSKVDAQELPLDEAVDILQIVGRRGLDLDTAIRLSRGAHASIDKSANKLGQLMTRAGIISSVHLAKGLLDSLNTGLPLGMVLVETNVVYPSVLEWCLTAQSMINAGQLTDEQAAQALRLARLNDWEFEQALRQINYVGEIPQRKFGTSELLVLANALTETQLLAAREVSLVQGKPVEEALIECGMVSDKIVNAAEQLIPLIKQGALFEDQAATIVRKLCRCSTAQEMVEILGDLETQMQSSAEVVQVMDLIGLCRLVSPEQLIDALAIARKNKTPLIQTMIESGMLTMDVFDAANECKRLLDAGALDMEQGIIALTYAAENETTFTDSLEQFGWCRQLVPSG